MIKPLDQRLERAAMAAWATHRGVTRDIERRWAMFADCAEGDQWRAVAKATLATLEIDDLQAAVDSLTSYLLDNTEEDQGFEVIEEIDQARSLVMEFIESEAA